MVTTRPDLRVGDAERDTTATLLREHYAQGRLSTDELNDRLDATFSATTQGQLAEITHDLPHLQAAPPVRRPAAAVPHQHGRGLARVVALLAVVVSVLGVVFIVQHAGNHVPRTLAELFVLLLVLRAMVGRLAGGRHREHHAARYIAEGYNADGYNGDGYPSDEYNGHSHPSGDPGRHFHEHHHEHRRGRNGHSYGYGYTYEWSDGSDHRSESERSERLS